MFNYSLPPHSWRGLIFRANNCYGDDYAALATIGVDLRVRKRSVHGSGTNFFLCFYKKFGRRQNIATLLV